MRSQGGPDPVTVLMRRGGQDTDTQRGDQVRTWRGRCPHAQERLRGPALPAPGSQPLAPGLGERKCLWFKPPALWGLPVFGSPRKHPCLPWTLTLFMSGLLQKLRVLSQPPAPQQALPWCQAAAPTPLAPGPPASPLPPWASSSQSAPSPSSGPPAAPMALSTNLCFPLPAHLPPPLGSPP